MVASLLGIGAVWTVLFVAYALAPLGRRLEGTVAVQLVVWLLVLFGVIGSQILAVSRSPYPNLRALQAAAISLPMFLLLFSVAYYVSGQIDAGNFSQPLTRIDALYFAVTVFATVGFGDIVANTEGARLMVTLQMLADLVLVGLFAKVLLGTARRRRQALDGDDPAPGR